jgi:2-polyprenyl-3-methyl-5-hydroxy-6-metoxy-1,4-benzoquinol methylase
MDPIEVPVAAIRSSVDRWDFHLDTVLRWQEGDTLPAEQTPYYHGVAKYKRDGGRLWPEVGTGSDVKPRLIAARVERFRTLYRSIRDNGYDRSIPIHVGISARGGLHIANGHHRAAIATAMQIESLPGRVRARHERWARFRKMLAERFSAQKLYTAIPHPDLASWAVARDSEQRVKAILQHVRPGQSVVDVGCHAGTFSFALADHGCPVTAIEKSGRLIECAKVVEAFSPRPKPIEWRSGDAWSQEAPRHDVVLCLSVLHHTLKDGTFDAAVTWIKAHGDRLVLELADGTETQMKGIDLPNQEHLGPWLEDAFGMRATPILKGVPREFRKGGSDRRWLWLMTKA